METARKWLAAYEQANVPVMQELLADNFVNHTPPLPPDKAGFIADAVAFRASFPEGVFSINDLMAKGDRVMLYGHFEGAHTGAPFCLGPQLCIPAKDPPAVASFDFMVLFRIEDGQITDRWATGDDVTGLLIPLGFQLVPPEIP
jgi:predicted ester cyclase